jgi:regulator of protease activity HflC (stomatin/prohibitin superfamily)
MNSKGQIGVGAAILVLLIFMVFVLTFGWVNVHPTEVAVEINKVAGQIIEQPKGVGYHFFNRWVTDMVIYKVAARAFPAEQLGEADKKFYELDVKTIDGQNVRVDFTLLYALRANEVPKLHQEVGQNYEDQIILPQIRSEARLAIGSYSAEELYQGKVRDEIQTKIKEKLVAALTKYPAIQINDALIRNFDFSVEFERAIEQKKVAAQSVEINKNLALAAEEMAKKTEADARGGKLQAIQVAQGQAEAVKVNADAERYRLEQEAAGKLAGYKADAEGKRLQAEALGGGKNVVALKFAETLPPTFKTFVVPVGQQTTSLFDINGLTKGLFSNDEIK